MTASEMEQNDRELRMIFLEAEIAIRSAAIEAARAVLGELSREVYPGQREALRLHVEAMELRFGGVPGETVEPLHRETSQREDKCRES